MIGTKLLNRYEITRELGRGGMGVVYMARDPVLDRDVAIKIITPDHVSPESVERFKREARVVAKMDHPAIVSVYDSGEHQGSMFFVMPVVKGKNLRFILKNEPLRLGELIDLGIQVAEALDYSHSLGVIHRDIKPENIMISRGEAEGFRVRITDFGLAVAQAQDRLTKTAAIVGTVAYMSPEQVGGAELDAHSDIYSLGTVLYECLVGQPPFTGEVQSLLYRISHEIPMPLRSIQPNIDEELEAIILRCLAKDRVKRPSGREVADTLIRYKSKVQSDERNLTMLPTATSFNVQRQPVSRPFVGREKEFTELQHRLNASVAGECQLVLIAGEAGIGKTRLLEELDNLAKARSIPVLHGRNVEIEHSLPYQGYCEIIQDYFRTRTGSETPTDFSDLASDLISLFPMLAEIRELGGDSEDSLRAIPEGGATGVKRFEDRTYIYELIARTITRMAASKPLVLLLEDLHAADVSIEALDYVVRRLGPTSTLIVGTYRSTDVDKRHRITKLLSGFKGDRRYELITLGPLSPSEHRNLLARLTGGSKLEEDLAQRLYQATDGNPYFTAELARSLMDSGAIVKDDSGILRLSSETAISMNNLPATIQQTVEERIERLPDAPREILSVASILGRSFEFADLENLTEEDDLENSVELLIRAGFIEEERQSRSDRLAFSSGVVRDVLYASLPRRKRRGIHRKHAEELEKRNKGRLERVYAQLFDHYTQGDVPEKVIEYGFLLAKKSLDTLSPDDAMRTIRTVLDFLEDDEGDRNVKGDAKVLLASAHRMTGNYNAAMKELEQAIEIFEKSRNNEKVLDCIVTAAEMSWHGMKVNETRRWVERGLALAGKTEDKNTLSRLLSLAATVANLRGEYEEAREYLEQAEKLKPAREESKQEILRGGTLLAAVTNPCAARHPVDIAFNEEAEIWTNVFETIVAADAMGNLLPHLCERWETLNDGASFLFTLRKNIHFHDGTLLTADQLKTGIEFAIKRSSDVLPSALEAISEIVVVSENVIRFDLADRLTIFPALLTDPRTAVCNAGSSSAGGSPAFLGTGPFKISSFTDRSIQLERNNSYWKGNPPYLDGIEFRVGFSSAEIAEQFRTRKLDLVRDLLPDDLDEILRDRRHAATLVDAPLKNIYFIIMNTTSPLGRNAALRRALAGSVHMHDLVRSTMGRSAQPAEGLYPPGILGHDPGRRSYPLEPEKLKELLVSSELNFPIRVQASVHPLLLDRYAALTRELFKYWSELGVQISVKTTDIKSYNDTWEKNEGIDLLIGRWIADYDDPDTFTHGLFHSSIGHFRHYFSSPQMDQQIEEARLQQQPEQRERIYRAIEKELMEEGIVIPLFHEIGYRVAGPKVRNLTLSGNPPYVNYAQLQKSETAAASVTPRIDREVIRIPMQGPLESLDPALTSTFPQAYVLPIIFETLTGAVGGGKIVPHLAASFKAEQGGRQFRFQLREGLRFHDGRRVTSRDVRYSFERLLKRKDSISRFLLSPIRGAAALLEDRARELEGFRIISALDFVIDLEQPLSFFPAMLTYTPAAIVPEGTREMGGTWKEGAIGTGPFRVAAFDPGRALKLEANPNYWIPGIPKSASMEFAFGVSPAQIIKGFRSGQFSVASELLAPDVEALLHEPEFAAKYKEIPGIVTYYLIFNVRRKPFSDEAIRHRFINSLDVFALVSKHLGRLGLPAYSFAPPALLGYEPTAASRPARPARLPEEIEMETMIHTIYQAQYPALMEDITNTLEEQGFRIKMVGKKAEQVLSEDYGAADLIFMRFTADYPDADSFYYYLLHSRGGMYRDIFGDPVIDRLIEKARREVDAAVRHSIYREIEDYIRQHALVLPLFHVQNYMFARPEVDGLELNYFTPYVSYHTLSISR